MTNRLHGGTDKIVQYIQVSLQKPMLRVESRITIVQVMATSRAVPHAKVEKLQQSDSDKDCPDQKVHKLR